MSYAVSKPKDFPPDYAQHAADSARPPAARPVALDAAAVPADGQSVVYLLNLGLGSRVTVDGPDPDAFDVTDDTVALAFSIPGRYTISVAPLEGGPAARLAIDAMEPRNAPEDFVWSGPAPPLPAQTP